MYVVSSHLLATSHWPVLDDKRVSKAICIYIKIALIEQSHMHQLSHKAFLFVIKSIYIYALQFALLVIFFDK